MSYTREQIEEYADSEPCNDNSDYSHTRMMLAQLLEENDALREDAARDQWLANNKLRIVPPGMDGPAFPKLEFAFDYWCETPHLHNQQGLAKAIDAARHSVHAAVTGEEVKEQSDE